MVKNAPSLQQKLLFSSVFQDNLNMRPMLTKTDGFKLRGKNHLLYTITSFGNKLLYNSKKLLIKEQILHFLYKTLHNAFKILNLLTI